MFFIFLLVPILDQILSTFKITFYKVLKQIFDQAPPLTSKAQTSTKSFPKTHLTNEVQPTDGNPPKIPEPFSDKITDVIQSHRRYSPSAVIETV